MIIVLLGGCRTERLPTLDPEDEEQARHSPEDTDPYIKGWKESDFVNLGFHLYSHPPEVAAYGFNPSGYVNATVGEMGSLTYPGMFWKLDANRRLVIADDRQFTEIYAVLEKLADDGATLVVHNHVRDRTEKYYCRDDYVKNWQQLLRPNTNSTADQPYASKTSTHAPRR